MACPQTEDGYTKIANELLDIFQKSKFNGTQFRIINCILRYTYGFKRKSHKMSDGFISKATGINTRQINRELKKLTCCKVVIIYYIGDRICPREIGINKNYSEWINCIDSTSDLVGTDEIDSTDELDRTGTVYLVPNVLSKKTVKKEILKKDIKENIYSDFCIEILEHWNSKQIIIHKESEEIIKIIDLSLKKYTKDDIKISIDRYNMILKDENYFFNYKWTLKDFLNRRSGISEFTDKGSKWINYCSRSNKNTYRGGVKNGSNGKSAEDELKDLGIGIY